MLCPLCNQRGADQVADTEPLARWRCRKCHGEYPVYQGYPVHPDALVAAENGQVRCPVCGACHTERIPDAPQMGASRVFRCLDCQSIFPALLYPAPDADAVGPALSAGFLPVHPQAMIDTVAGVDRLPTFFGLSQRLREYLEHTGFTIVRTEDRVDMDTQVREFAFYFVPDAWVEQQPERAQAVQATIGFAWHAGLAQMAGAPATSVSNPVLLELSLSVIVNPSMIARTLPAYLRIVAGLSNVLQALALDEATAIESEMVVSPHTQEAAIRRLSAVRRFTLDLTSPEQWTGLIMEMPRHKMLLDKVWELMSTNNGN